MEPEPVENNSIHSQPVRKENIKGSKKPQNVIRLLTAREAFAAFPGLYYQRLYHMVDLGHVQALRRHGRTLYSEAELAQALRAAIAAALEYSGLIETAA